MQKAVKTWKKNLYFSLAALMPMKSMKTSHLANLCSYHHFSTNVTTQPTIHSEEVLRFIALASFIFSQWKFDFFDMKFIGKINLHTSYQGHTALCCLSGTCSISNGCLENADHRPRKRNIIENAGLENTDLANLVF